MTLLLWLLSAALVALGVLGLVLPGLPSAPLVLAGIVLAAWIDGFARIGWVTLTVAIVLALLAAVADHIGVVLGARRFGGSRWGAVGAFAGMLLGLPFGIVGIVLGPFVGAVGLELLVARKERNAALRAGLGTVAGLVVATAAKAALIAVMLGIAVLAWLV